MPGPAPAIDGPFNGQEQIRFALHLVERHRRRAPNQRFRVASGQLDDVEIVEGKKPAFSRGQHLDQRTLSGLARTRDHDGRHDTQPLGQRRLDMAG